MTRPWVVTGAGGFIGARVCRLLAARAEPFVGLLRPGERPPEAPDGTAWPAERFRTVDLRDPAAAAACLADLEPQVVLHLAALGVAPGAGEPLAELVAVNVLAPGLLCAALPRDAVLVQAGSMSQYAGGDAPLAEDLAPRIDATPYAWSKNAAESLLGLLAARDGKAVVCARLFGVTGAGEAPHRLLPSIVAGWRAGREIPLSDGAQVRDVLHVDDVAAALLHVARAPALRGRAVNIGRGAGRSVRELAERAARRLGCAPLLRFGALPRRPGEAAAWVADAARLAASGFTPALDFERTIDRATDELAGRAPRAGEEG